MCGYCGCGQSDHQHEHHHEHDQRLIAIEQDILAANQDYADKNRAYLSQRGMLALNFVSSPGSGKTTLLVETIRALGGAYPISVIEGDQQTDRDAQRIAETGVSVLQINTGKSCHLDAHRIGHALQDLPLEDNSLVFIENVGNLVCPALFDLGERAKVVILSVTEGDDKPLKYPHMFDQATLMIINKIDLLPYVTFDVDACVAYAKRINPEISVLKTAATTGEGIDVWCDWLRMQKHNDR
jgi:hydrogenase nickel incorporation protein HypB